VGLGLELVADKVLKSLGLEGGSQLPLADFLRGEKDRASVYGAQSRLWQGRSIQSSAYLNVAQHVLLDRREGDGPEEIWRLDASC
jgi:hypothetical protein